MYPTISPTKLFSHKLKFHLILGILICVMLSWKQSYDLIESSPISIPEDNVHSQRCDILQNIGT